MPSDTKQPKISAFFTRSNGAYGKPRGSPSTSTSSTEIELDPIIAQPGLDQSTTNTAIAEVRHVDTTEDPETRQRNGNPDICAVLASEDVNTTASDTEAVQSSDRALQTTAVPTPSKTTIQPQTSREETARAIQLTSSMPTRRPQGPPASRPPRPEDSQFSLRLITTSDLPTFKRLLNTLLPVSYPSSFFTSITNSNSTFSRIAIWHHRPHLSGPIIGGIKCRIEPVPALPMPDGTPGPCEAQLYIQALGVLAPYRRFGVARALLEEVLGEAVGGDEERDLESGKVKSVYAHVWQENPEALEWYRGRGFEVEELVEGYYSRLKPAGAWMVRKKLGN